MEFQDVQNIIETFKNLKLEELKELLTDIYKVQKENEERYNNIVEQVFIIIHKLQREIERKLPPESESDNETYDSNDEIKNYDIRLIDVYSDEE